jgi:geranylgeranyl diphosphate synthase type I
VARVFDEMLTSRSLNAEQIQFLQQTMIGCGAVAKTERMIEDLANQSLEALSELEISEAGKAHLRGLALKVINRDK